MAYDPFATLKVTHQSSRVMAGGTFVALQGQREHGSRYIGDALARGAHRIVVEETTQLEPAIIEQIQQAGAQLNRVAHGRKALAQLSAEAYGFPAQQLKIIGITGTKGKTTTTFLTCHILQQSGYKTALLSSVHNAINGTIYPTELTTQHADYIHAFLRHAVEAGVTHVVMEVAAQALSLHRVDGLTFEVGAWLNFSHEHGEFYATEADYFSAKCLLINQLRPAGSFIVSGDDERLATLPLRSDINRTTYHTAQVVLPTDRTKTMVGCWHEATYYEVPALAGSYNGENLLVAIMIARSLGVPATTLQQALTTFAGVPGRFNIYDLPNGARCCIDYAHNPSSFEAVLQELRSHTEQLIVVFGAGGDRDRAKRPVMGAIVARYADAIFLTTDNPRSESPEAICNEIAAGIAAQDRGKISIVLDRKEAIKAAYRLTRPGSIIALLGKGADEYQIIAQEKQFFSEREIIATLEQ